MGNEGMPRALFDRIDELARLRHADGAFSVRAGSLLAGDDAASSPYEVSHAVHRHLDIAIDHLLAIKIMAIDAGTLPTYGAFTLLRAAVENFGSAKWLLSGHDRGERIRRVLHFHAANQAALGQARELAAQAAQQAGQTVISNEEPVRALRRVATQNGLTMGQIRAGGGWKSVVRSLGMDEATSNTVEYLWKSCSAFAHGDQWPSIAFLHKEELPTSNEKVAHLKLTVSFSNLTPMLELTLSMGQLVFHTFNSSRQSKE